MKNTVNSLTDLLGVAIPVLVAPMFLVSNVKMVVAAMESGAAACIPALNYRTGEGLTMAIRELHQKKTADGAFGINIIVNKSNLKYKEQLDICCREKVDFIITSLGNPKEVIEKAHARGIKVFCDVVNLSHALKVEALGCDALIAVNKSAGGHRGELSSKELITQLAAQCAIPIISAGGVGDKKELEKILSYGAIGASVGSPFIASVEADVSVAYKQACVKYGAKDIVVTKKISGTPCTVINTPYVQKTGTEETWLECVLNKNKRLKKWVKLARYLKGTSIVQKAATEATYKNLWVAGPSIEHTKEISSVKSILNRFV